MEGIKILNRRGGAYKIIMYLLRLDNPKDAYASKMNRETDCSTHNSWMNANNLNERGFITCKKEGGIKYLKLTDKGRKLALMIAELEKKLR